MIAADAGANYDVVDTNGGTQVAGSTRCIMIGFL